MEGSSYVPGSPFRASLHRQTTGDAVLDNEFYSSGFVDDGFCTGDDGHPTLKTTVKIGTCSVRLDIFSGSAWANDKFPALAGDVDAWDDVTFLNKAKVTIKGKVTRAAILLLGRTESEHFINPAEAKIRWVLKDAKSNDKDYHIESCPLLLAVDKIYTKIRNLKYRFLKNGTLFPDEVDQYEPFVIREAINNCIAHQDYTKGDRLSRS